MSKESDYEKRINRAIFSDPEDIEKERYGENSPRKIVDDLNKLASIKEGKSKVFFMEDLSREEKEAVFNKLGEELGLKKPFQFGEMFNIATWVIEASERAKIVKDKGFRIGQRVSSEGFRGTLEEIADDQKIKIKLDDEDAGVFGQSIFEAEPEFVVMIKDKKQ